MKILFVSSSCSNAKYEEVYNMRSKKLIEPQQKFCRLLIDGLSSVEEIEVDCLSALPISASTVKRKLFKKENEIVSNKLRYRYLAFFNGKILRYVSLYINAFKDARAWAKKNKNEQKVIICDALSYYITRPVQFVAKLHGIKCVGIITDLPMLTTSMKDRKESLIKKAGLFIFQKLTEKSLQAYDAYIPLTESINDYVNTTNKSYIVIEGSVDNIECKQQIEFSKRKILLYAGGIYEKYGLKRLVEAFSMADTNDYELHVYGEGSYVPELEKIAKKNAKIHYKGMATLEEIVIKEKEASILVNPRPSDENFSKYSFPSKTLEYMVSKTPLLTTRLPGIPEEYFKYVLSFEDESLEGMKKTLNKVLKKDDVELADMGSRAYDFVIASKNNCIQGKRIVEFIKKI